MPNNVVPFARSVADERPNPYATDAVAAAMDAISPSSGGTISDVQAVAELCLIALIDFTKREAEEGLEGDPEYGQIMAELVVKLKIAAALMEAAPYVEVDFD